MNADWTKPDYPGDAVRIALLIRGRELGDVRIQDYGSSVKTNRYNIGMFLPGVVECSPGDTPKIWPDHNARCNEPATANSAFEQFLQAAYAEGWKDYDRETGKAAV